MTKAVAFFVRSVNGFNYRLGKITSQTIWAIIGILLYGAVSRYVFNSPLDWSHEILAYIFLGYFIIAGGYALLKDAHVRMDVLYSRWSPKRKAITDMATFSLIAVYLVILIWRGIVHSKIAVEIVERTNTNTASLVAPIKIVLVIGLTILLIQAIAFFIQDIYTARGKTLG